MNICLLKNIYILVSCIIAMSNCGEIQEGALAGATTNIPVGKPGCSGIIATKCNHAYVGFRCGNREYFEFCSEDKKGQPFDFAKNWCKSRKGMVGICQKWEPTDFLERPDCKSAASNADTCTRL